jgi:hypothetical protein
MKTKIGLDRIEVKCKRCGRVIGTCVRGDTQDYAVVMRSKREHDMHWCPERDNTAHTREPEDDEHICRNMMSRILSNCKRVRK